MDTSAGLVDGQTATTPVIAHAIDFFQERGIAHQWACCIYATAPFIRSSVIRRGLELVVETESDYAFPVTSFPFPIQRSVRINEKGLVEMFYPEHFSMRSQDLEDASHDAGQFYWGRPEAWLEEKPIFSGKSVPVRLPRSRVQDIDTVEDWQRAELMFESLQDDHPLP